VTRFHDKRSRLQIAAFRLLELHAARWRNAKNLERWNDSCRERWEVEQVQPLTPEERAIRNAVEQDLIGLPIG
jgi:hypothetical protein